MKNDKASFTLNQWLTWMEQAHTSAIDMGLTRCQAVFDAMALDFGNTRVVSVAGTNGKGSSVAMLDSTLRAAGFQTVCYTSPHLEVYNERVVINGIMSSDQQLIAAFNAVDQARESVGISLSYFEIGTLAALWIVAQEQPDVAILEVGLGGRLDVVNLVDADVAIVTTVGIDHVDWLGDDRNTIGWEKAGIFRHAKMAVCGDHHPPPSIAQYAKEVGANLFQASSAFKYVVNNNHTTWSFHGLTAQGQALNINDLPLPQLPLQNAATVVQALQLLDLPVPTTALHQGLKTARVKGRMDNQLYHGVPMILDVAHNPQAAEYLVQRLSGQRFHVILGMLADKDCRAVIAMLSPIVEQWHLVSLDVPRGQTAKQLATMLPVQTMQPVHLHSSVDAAMAANAHSENPLLVAGSFITVAAAYRILDQGAQA